MFPVTTNGQRARPGEPGILVHRGPTVSLGYWRRPEETARVLKPNPLRPPYEGQDIVCYSGDLVVEDEEGYFYFVGRKDEMIKSAGYRISPTEVEDVLMGTGTFRQVAVIGLPDEWVGQKICAVGVALSGPVDTADVLRQTAPSYPDIWFRLGLIWSIRYRRRRTAKSITRRSLPNVHRRGRYERNRCADCRLDCSHTCSKRGGREFWGVGNDSPSAELR